MVHMDTENEVLTIFPPFFGNYFKWSFPKPNLLNEVFSVFLEKFSLRKKDSMGHVNWTFDKPAEVFTQRTENFLSKARIRK